MAIITYYTSMINADVKVFSANKWVILTANTAEI